MKREYKIFIDGSAGTTGLRIRERLCRRDELYIITLPEEKRKNPEERYKALNDCDLAFLCLPDAAAIEAVEMLHNPNTVVIDTSTAHRTNPAWTYGFPELSATAREKIKLSKRIAVPGCHASGFVSLIYPLTEAGLLPTDARLCAHSLTGYSGGGKKMIEAYETPTRDILYDAPRQYALTQTHKHLPEMTAITGLTTAPLFCPIVADYYSGMEVTVPLFASQLNCGTTGEKNNTIDTIKDIYKRKYSCGIVSYTDNTDGDGMLAANALSGTDSMEITVLGNDERLLLVSRFDNLGKGASGAAIQCMNLAFGMDEAAGLELKASRKI